MAANWFVECQRYFVESPILNGKGKPKSIPVTIRKMHIHGNFIVTDYLRVTLVKRKGEVSFCVKERKKPVRPWWDKTPIKEEECKMVREGSYNREAFIKWLGGRIGQDALAAVVELETCPPDNVKRLAA